MNEVSLATLWLAAAAPLVLAQGYEFPWLNREVVIRGDMFQAASVAYEDFSKVLAERQARLTTEKNQQRARYLASIGNFDVQVGKGPGRYVVWFTARSSPDFPGDSDDAGAIYTIDATSFAVTRKVY